MTKKITSVLFLVISDITVVVASYLLAYLIRNEILPNLVNKFEAIPLLPLSTFLNHFIMISTWLFIFLYEGLYTKRYTYWDEVKVLLKSATLASSFIMIVIFITKMRQFSRTVVILAWLMSLLLFPIFRYFTKILLIKANLWKKKLIIIGVHQTSLQILKSITRINTLGYEVLGFLDDDPKKIGKKYCGVEVLGPTSELENLAKNTKSRDIMIATPHLPRRKLKELFTKCENLSESLWIIPRSADFISEGVEVEVLEKVLTLHVKRNLSKPWNIFIKRLYEICLSLILTIIFVPLFILISIAIKLDSKGPILFLQNRLGQRNKDFNIIKFRSMYINNDMKLAEYIDKNPDNKEEWEKYKKLKNNDPRVTRVGKIIRKLSLDELPQLFNVLLGNMSLVGPRPYIAEELNGKDTFINNLAKVKPGITGLWQISGRSELPFIERISLDEYYIRNWSLWLDAVILFKSVKVFFSSKGAY